MKLKQVGSLLKCKGCGFVGHDTEFVWLDSVEECNGIVKTHEFNCPKCGSGENEKF